MTLKKSYLIGTILLLFSGLFYWYQIHPAQIKHECSWVKQESEAKPAIPAMTKEQLIEKGIIRSCQTEIELARKVDPYSTYELGTHKIFARFSPSEGIIKSMFDDPIWEATSCIRDGDKIIAEYEKPREAVPAKEWYEKASDEQYKFCLHDKGL